MSRPILDHVYGGLAWPTDENVVGWPESAPEMIGGAFRVISRGVHDRRVFALLGNGESPEKFWMVEDLDALARVEGFGRERRPSGMDNYERSLKALSAIAYYDAAEGTNARIRIAHEDERMEVIGDFLCDLQHLAHRLGLSWSELLARGAYHNSRDIEEESEDE